jgi:hypothetical protein
VQSNSARAGLLIVLAAAAVILFIVLSGGDSGDGTDTTTGGDPTEVTVPTEPAVETIQLRDGAPVGGVRELTYQNGDTVRIVVQLDEPQEDIHIHGYDEEVLNPQRRASFDFPAKLDGIFELEAHGPDGDVVLAEIRVNP